MKPSVLDILPSKHITKRRMMPESITMESILSIFLWDFTRTIRPIKPMIKVIWIMLEPMFVPIAMLLVSIPFKTSMLTTRWVKISGREVAMERTVRPMKASVMLMAFAIFWRFMTAMPALIQMPIRPNIRYNI